MRFIHTFTLLVVLVGSGLYLHTQVEAVCKMPLSYQIGEIDARFDSSFDEARVAIADAESVWEQATGENLFTYDPNGELTINFVFDDRQEFALAEVNFRERLNEAENVNEEIKSTYDTLTAEYDTLETKYKENATAYEEQLAAYNARVEEYNENGGAPPDAYDALEEERKALDDAHTSLQRQGQQLNELADRINTISEEGNEFVEEYNENVDSYNETFGESHEFTQGDYQNDRINIYKFIDTTELKLVLAHELGHALSLGHVPGDTSIMHHLMGGQPADIALTEHDLNEFEHVCGQTTRSWIERLFILFGV